MKKLSKTLFAIAAVSAASMAMTASAMAMTASYDETTGIVTLAGVETRGVSQTLLIVPEGIETVTETDIYQINQEDGTTDAPATFEDDEIKLDMSKLTPGATYEVRIGGTDGKMDTATFIVPNGGEVTTDVIKVGDATLDGRISSGDASAISKFLIESADSDTENVDKSFTVVEGIDADTIIKFDTENFKS